MNGSSELLTRKSLALALKCSERTIIRLQRKGLPVIYLGTLPRYDIDEVLAWLDKNRMNLFHLD